MEPVTTTTTVTTSTFVMPSPTQLIIGGVALGVGLTAGYGLACWTASLVDAGIEKSGIKERVKRLMSKEEEVEEVEEVSDALDPKTKAKLEKAMKQDALKQGLKWNKRKFSEWANKNAETINSLIDLENSEDEDALKQMVKLGKKLNNSAINAGLVKKTSPYR
jgi:hypothetical protein